ncbi:DUF4232 domain-containing protein [Promicromonospora sp. NPDC052451]|uniref:DUF4232 domain-containing protein n=1 Tax=Promicromonospora sp. NPDC052451 TaxID=3364407 RepID=UPI0037CC1021
MITRQRKTWSYGVAAAALLLATTGCSGTSADDSATSGTPTAEPSVTTSPPSTTESPSDGSQPTATDTAPGGTPTASDGAGDGAAPESTRCLTPDLAGSLAPIEGGGSAGHYEVAIVLTNTSGTDCVLQGWPGASFVGDGDGTQIGAAATLDRSSPHEPVTLAPGDAAHAVVLVSNAENYGDECRQTPADGLRVYPPGETRSLFVQDDELTLVGCASAEQELLEVGAFQPGE